MSGCYKYFGGDVELLQLRFVEVKAHYGFVLLYSCGRGNVVMMLDLISMEVVLSIFTARIMNLKGAWKSS